MVRFLLIGTKAILSLWYNVRIQNNQVGMSGIKNISGLGIIGTKVIVFLRHDVRAETNKWRNGFRSRGDPIARGADEG